MKDSYVGKDVCCHRNSFFPTHADGKRLPEKVERNGWVGLGNIIYTMRSNILSRNGLFGSFNLFYTSPIVVSCFHPAVGKLRGFSGKLSHKHVHHNNKLSRANTRSVVEKLVHQRKESVRIDCSTVYRIPTPNSLHITNMEHDLPAAVMHFRAYVYARYQDD